MAAGVDDVQWLHDSDVPSFPARDASTAGDSRAGDSRDASSVTAHADGGEARDAGASGEATQGATLDASSGADAASSTIGDAARGEAGQQTAYQWRLPAHFPTPQVPEDNPMSEAKVELGRHLFYDVRLSANGTYSCASCHKQALAFSDERATALGSTGVAHPRSSMSLANIAYSQTLTWANPLLVELERQAIVPEFGDAPEELGNTSIPDVEARLRAIGRYNELFAAAFPGEVEPVTLLSLNRALAAFERTIISGNSAYDRYTFGGDHDALSEAAQRGQSLVTTDADPRFLCSRCHGGFNLSDHVTWQGKVYEPPIYHQTGLYDLDGHGAYPEPNTGIHEVTQRDVDMGKFKAPTLRNIALTAPYMHDGSLATLSDVLDHYAQGGRAKNVERTDPLLRPFAISAAEKADIIAFLESLTDETLLHDPRLSDPFHGDAGI